MNVLSVSSSVVFIDVNEILCNYNVYSVNSFNYLFLSMRSVTILYL